MIASKPNILCVTPFNFFPLIKRVTQFLITPIPSSEGKKRLVSYQKTGFTCKSKSESYHTHTSLIFLSQAHNCDTKRNVYLLGQAEIIFLFFSNTEKSPSLFSLPQPLLQSLGRGGTVEQTGGYNFSIQGKKKIPACPTRCTTLHYNLTFQKPPNSSF